MSDELRLNSFLIEIGFSVCPGLDASQILHHIKLDKTELFRQTLQTADWADISQSECGGSGGGGETDRALSSIMIIIWCQDWHRASVLKILIG